MKRIFAALLMSAAFYFSSCTSNDNTNNLVVVPKADSVSKGGYINISFNNKTFVVRDLIVQRTPIYSLIAAIQATDQNDTLWIAQLQSIDHKSRSLGMNLTIYNNTSGSAVGTYMVKQNNCTITDNSEGENKVYSVRIGSSVEITHSNFTTEGSMSLNLYHNGVAYPATGSFVIYN